MPSKKEQNKNPYAGWTDPALSDPAFERTLNRFIPPGCGKHDLDQQAEPAPLTQSKQLQTPLSAIAAVNAEASIEAQPIESITRSTPLVTPLATPLVSPPASHPEPTAVTPLDATHTASEQKVYSVMYRLSISKGKHERHFTNKELLETTGIRSPYTIRLAIDGLEAKRSIDIVWKSNGSRLGDRYRIYTPREIFARRREIGIEIDPQSKKIVTPLATPLVTPLETRGVPLQKLEGWTAPSFLNLNNNKMDDDTRAYAHEGEIDLVLRSFFPSATQKEIEQAHTEMEQLIATELRERAAHAITPPVSPQYFVECIRRLCSASKLAETAQTSSGKQNASRSALKRKIEALAKQVRDAHTGTKLTFADFSEALKRRCAGEGLPYDSDLLTEVITRLSERR